MSLIVEPMNLGFQWVLEIVIFSSLQYGAKNIVLATRA